MMQKLSLSKQITIHFILAWIINDTSKIRIKFDGRFLNQFPPTILHGNIVNVYIVYEITNDFKDINYPTLENCLFGWLIQDMVLDLIEKHLFRLVMTSVKM